MAYSLLAFFLKLVARAFFRQIEITGLELVPKRGPVIFAGNHPNSLLDPVLIIVTAGRKVHFAAKDTLFKSAILRVFLRGLGAVPIARADDHKGKGKVDNASAFDAMFAVLGAGGAIGIFPEGLSHDASQLARLKTGAARLAFGASATTSEPVAVVPCGLTFIHPSRFRSRVLVQFGDPIFLDAARVARHEADGPEAVRELTADIERGLRELTVNAADWDTVRTLAIVRRLYQPLHIRIDERVELARRFNTHYPEVADDPRVVTLMRRVHDYQGRLDQLGVVDSEVARGLSSFEISLRVLRYAMLVLFWAPLTLPGAPLHFPVIMLAKISGKWLTPRKDVVATTKVVTSMFLVLLAYAVVIGVVFFSWGLAYAALAAFLLPLSGFATLRVLDGTRLLGRGLFALGRRLRIRQELVALRSEREALSSDVIDLVGALKPQHMVSLFPRTPEPA